MAKKKNKKNKVGNNESTVADNQVAIVTSALAQISMNEPQRSRNPQTAPVPRATKKTIVAEFQRYFGDESKLENWQRLCKDVGIDEDLPSITKCREALRKIWVNIYDLVDAVAAGTCPPNRFRNQHALARYTIKNKKAFPKYLAKDGGPVRALLAHIF